MRRSTRGRLLCAIYAAVSVAAADEDGGADDDDDEAASKDFDGSTISKAASELSAVSPSGTKPTSFLRFTAKPSPSRFPHTEFKSGGGINALTYMHTQHAFK